MRKVFCVLSGWGVGGAIVAFGLGGGPVATMLLGGFGAFAVTFWLLEATS